VETLLQAEERPEHRTVEIARFVDTVNIPLFGVDPAGAVNEWNRSISRLTGWAKEEAMGKNFVETFLAEASRAAFRVAFRQTLAGTGSNLIQTPLCIRDGEKVVVLFSCTPRYGAGGEPAGGMGAGLVITELIRECEELERRLEARTGELDKACAELSRIAGMRQQFQADINHRLLTPMNSLFGFIDLLRGQYFGKLNAKQMEYLSRMANSVSNLLALIKELLADAGNGTDDGRMEARRIMPEQFFRAAQMLMADRYEQKGVAFQLDLDRDLPVTIGADFSAARQVVSRLLQWALERSVPGGHVRLAVSRINDGQVRCRIRTAGVVPETHQPESFPGVHGPADSGPGLEDDLAVLQAQVRGLGGDLGIESLAGPGRAFWFTLGECKNRAERKEERPADNCAAGPAPAAARRRILVAEDNEANLLMITALLRTRGYEAEVARNGEEAVEKARELKPDLILMDIRMPVMDGIEATRQLRVQPEFADVPIVAVTAGVDPWSWEQLLDAGCSERLAKPIVARDLVALLRRYIGEGNRVITPALSASSGTAPPSLGCVQLYAEAK